MIVFGSTLSPFVRKVMVYGAEKELALELRPSGMGRDGPEFEAASPFRKMPALIDPDADFAISDSTAIVAYLEAKYPEPNLIPTEPKARARCVWFEEFADTILIAAGSKIFFNRLVAPRFLKQPGDQALADKAEAEELPPALAYLESIAPAGGYLVEDRLTLADIAVASPFVNFRDHLALDLSRWPGVNAYLDGILARPSFAALVAQERQVVASLG